jgi:hypothetical protein
VLRTALGDSYTSGPLIPDQTGVPAGCLRSTHNHPSLVAAALGAVSFTDASCAGATTASMTAPNAHGDVPYLRGTEGELNAMLAAEAAAGNATYVDTYGDSIGHDFCERTGVKWAEGLVPTSPAAPVHPNALGEEAMAQQVLAAAG